MGQNVRYFIRDDDVGGLTDGFRAFVEIFLSNRIPISLQIIPAQLTDECAAFLVGLQKAHPDLVEFGQHGLHHTLNLAGQTLYREFGPELPLDVQSKIVEDGKAILDAKLAEARPTLLFTPPQHKYDRNTVRAVAAAGHKVFSAAYYPGAAYQTVYALGRTLRLSSLGHQGLSYHDQRRPEADVRELSISLDVDDGEHFKRQAHRIDADLARAERRTDKVGLMFHHQLYADRILRSELEALVSQILRSRNHSQFHLLSVLALEGEA